VGRIAEAGLGPALPTIMRGSGHPRYPDPTIPLERIRNRVR
jgi:hypothetical protein